MYLTSSLRGVAVTGGLSIWHSAKLLVHERIVHRVMCIHTNNENDLAGISDQDKLKNKNE